MQIHIILIILLIIVFSLFPSQIVRATFHEDFVGQITNKTKIISNPLERIIEEALEKGQEIPIEDIITYFEIVYQFFPNIELAEKLLTLVFNQNPEKYSEILYKFKPLQKHEVDLVRQQILEGVGEAKLDQEAIWSDYGDEAWFIIESDAQRLIVATFSNQEEIDELNKPRNVVDEGTILLIKVIPIYDSDEKKVVTLDKTAKKLTAKIPELEGSAIGDEPVRAGCLMILDSEYLLYAKIIKTENGKWISIEEASTRGYEKEELSKAKTALKAIKIALDADDPTKLEKNINVLLEIIDEVSHYEETKILVSESEHFMPLVPQWIKNNAKLWDEGKIGDLDFTKGIEYLIKEKIIDISHLPQQPLENSEQYVPTWVQNNAGWWADDLISEEDFVNGIKYLVEQGIIRV